MLVLSLFPGIGLLDMAFEEAGFCVVRGPDVLWGGNIKTFHPPVGRFDGIIGGPPCKAFSQLVHIVRANGYTVAENLIPEYERVVCEAAPAWFLMENVRAAPDPVIEGYAVHSFLLNNRWVGGEQNRVRRFSFGVRGGVPIDLRHYLEIEALEAAEWAPAVCAGGGYRPTPVAINASGKVKSTAARNLGYTTATGLQRAIELQGLPSDFFKHSPLTINGKHEMIGNGVPLPMGCAIAKAVKEALEGLS